MASAKPKKGPRSGENARSGPPSPEANRAAKVISVRLDDEPREALESLSRRWKLSRSATVARLALEALGRPE